MIKIRRVLPVVAALSLVAAACGGSSDDGDEASDPTVAETVADDAEEASDDGEDFTEAEPTETEPTDEPEESEPTEEPAEEPGATEPAEEEPAPEDSAESDEEDRDVGDAAAAGFDVALSEWAIAAPTEYSSGEITFNASNGGSFPHEFVVIAGESYESLPLAEGGAVLEDELPTGALIGRTPRISSGSSEALTVTLQPGSYVLVCNLGGGANSHAGQGQRLNITVT